MMWYVMWAGKDDIKFQLVDHISHTEYLSAIRHAFNILLALPATTCTVERSFSTLRQVKTWLRSTMSSERLSALCMLSVHGELIEKSLGFINKLINKFSNDKRRRQFMFN